MVDLIIILAVVVILLKQQSPTLTKRGEKIKQKWSYLIIPAAEKWSVPENVIAGVIGIESDGNPYASGAAGEIGLMQMLPSTFEEYKKETGAKSVNLLNPVVAIDSGAWYINKISQAFPDEPWREKIKAYNTGIAGHQKKREPHLVWTSRYHLFFVD